MQGAQSPPLLKHCKTRSDTHSVQSLRQHVLSVLKLGGGSVYGLPQLLNWLATRDEMGLCSDPEEMEELMFIESLAWERATLPTIGKMLVKAAKDKKKARALAVPDQQAAMRLELAEREEARRKGPDLSHIPKPKQKRSSKKCGQKLANQIDELLLSIAHDEDDLNELIPLELEALLEEIRSEEPEVKPESGDPLRELLEHQLQLPYRKEDRPGLGLAVAAQPAATEAMPVVLPVEKSAWDEVAEAMPEEAARVGLASRLRNVLRQAPAGEGVIRLTVADVQALARMLLS